VLLNSSNNSNLRLKIKTAHEELVMDVVGEDSNSNINKMVRLQVATVHQSFVTNVALNFQCSGHGFVAFVATDGYEILNIS
jgi:hypothetical protein